MIVTSQYYINEMKKLFDGTPAAVIGIESNFDLFCFSPRGKRPRSTEIKFFDSPQVDINQQKDERSAKLKSNESIERIIYFNTKLINTKIDYNRCISFQLNSLIWIKR